MALPLSYTEQEMLESQRICSEFDFNQTKEIAEQIGSKPLIFTGMGSSVLFPGKQAKNRAIHFRLKNRIDVFFASDLLQYEDFSNITLFLCSNSGETKETILLQEYASKIGAFCIAVTARKNSTLAARCKETLFLSGEFEKGVAATKSVVEQGLIFDSLIFHLASQQGRDIEFSKLKDDLVDTASKIEENTNLKIEKGMVETLARYPRYLLVGLDNGVGEEIGLKFHETLKKPGIFYPDTHLIHGPGEALEKECVFMLDPEQFAPFLGDFQKFAQTTNSVVYSVGKIMEEKGIALAINERFRNYCLLAGGWGIIRNIANYLKLDIDHPQKISKIGNAYQ